MKIYDLSAEATEGMRFLQNAESQMPHSERRKTLSFVIRVRNSSLSFLTLVTKRQSHSVFCIRRTPKRVRRMTLKFSD